MNRKIFKFLLSAMLLPTTSIFASQEETVDIVNYNEGWRSYSYTANIICGIFQFENAKENSAQAKLNAKLLETFAEFEAETIEALETIRKDKLASKDFPLSSFFTGDIRGRSLVYLNKADIFSAKNEIYYHRGHGAFVIKEGINYKICPNGDIEKIELKDLFQAGENWIDPLLVLALDIIKETGREQYLWDGDAKAVISEILSYKKEGTKMTKQEYYIYSFALKEDSLVLIMQSLSLMPNASGYPIIEIPYKRIKHLNRAKLSFL